MWATDGRPQRHECVCYWGVEVGENITRGTEGSKAVAAQCRQCNRVGILSQLNAAKVRQDAEAEKAPLPLEFLAICLVCLSVAKICQAADSDSDGCTGPSSF